VKKHEIMSSVDKARLFPIRCASKKGQYVSEKDHRFVVDMFKKYPEEYNLMTIDVHNNTKPFGAL